MVLTHHTDCALRLLMFAALHPDRLVTVGEVARSFNISRNHLMKIAQGLARCGYIHTVRGKGGGLRLARPATGISLGDVVADMEPSFDIVDCDHRACPITGVCRLKRVLSEAGKGFLATLGGYTIADIVGNREEVLGRLAQIEA